jgi:hypothetical protein
MVYAPCLNETRMMSHLDTSVYKGLPAEGRPRADDGFRQMGSGQPQAGGELDHPRGVFAHAGRLGATDAGTQTVQQDQLGRAGAQALGGARRA